MTGKFRLFFPAVGILIFRQRGGRTCVTFANMYELRQYGYVADELRIPKGRPRVFRGSGLGTFRFRLHDFSK